MTIIRLTLLAFCIFLSGCMDKESLKYYQGELDIKNTQEAIDWYKANKTHIIELRDKALKNPKIRRVEFTEIGYASSYGELNEEDKKDYYELLAILGELKAIHLVVSKKGRDIHGDLISVGVTLRADGIVTTGGHIIAIEYVKSKKLIENSVAEGATYHKLDEPDWYVFEHIYD